MSFRRDDEDWLLYYGISPYTDAELAEIRRALLRVTALRLESGAAILRLANACDETAEAVRAFTDAWLPTEVDIACESFTLLDPSAPTAEDPRR